MPDQGLPDQEPPDQELPDPVTRLLNDARRRYTRVDVGAAQRLLAEGAQLVDIRPAWQRAREGEIEGSLIVERNHLEWRLHPQSESRIPQVERISNWIVVCSEGYTSSLAADALNSIGVTATDLIGGVGSWRSSGKELLADGITPADSRVIRGQQRPADPSQLGAPRSSQTAH